MHDHAGIQVSSHFVEHLDYRDLILLREVFRCLKPCDAASDDDDILIRRGRLSAKDLLCCDRAFNAGDGRQDRSSACCHEDCLRADRLEHLRICFRAKTHIHTCFLKLCLHSFHKFRDHSFIRRDRCEISGSAQFILRLEQNSVESAFCQRQGSFHARGASAYDRHFAAGAVFNKFLIAVLKFAAQNRVESTPQR